MGVSARPAWRTDMALLPSPLFYLPSPPPAQMTSMSPKLFPSVSPWEASYQALLIRAALLHRQCLDVKPCPNEPQESPLDLPSQPSSPPHPTPSPLEETEAPAAKTRPPPPQVPRRPRRRRGWPG